MPPQDSPKSVFFRSAVDGEWSDTIASIVPSSTAAQSRSWLPASRMGGQHLNCVAADGTSSARSAR